MVVQYALPRRGVPAPNSFRRWAGGASGVTLRIVGASEGRRLNRLYRGKRVATNVLSFPYGRGRGDVVLCHPVVVREARTQDKTLAAHYAHLVVHGVLHLKGYDHARAREAARMERAEVRRLRRLGFEDPYKIK